MPGEQTKTIEELNQKRFVWEKGQVVIVSPQNKKEESSSLQTEQILEKS